MTLGKHSGRVLEVRIAVPEEGRDRVRLALENLMRILNKLEVSARQLEQDKQRPRRIAHYEMMKGVLSVAMGEKLAQLRREQYERH